MKIGDVLKVKTSKGFLDAELLEERDTTVLVKLLNDGHIITRKKARDLQEAVSRI